MASYILILCIILALELVYIRIAKRAEIIDVPTSRSSHTRQGVVRGGGIVFLFGLLAWWILSGFNDPIAVSGIILVGAVSFADDICGVKISMRLVAQIIAVGMILWQAGFYTVTHPALWVVTLLGAVFVINAFNFMDGINGSLCLYSLVTFATLLYIDLAVVPNFISPALLIISTGSALIFSFFNARNRAICFAGDIGSITVGAITVYALISLVMATSNVGWIVLVAVYATDAALTLARRIALRCNIFQAHRMHAYQILSNEHGRHQLVVAGTIAALQLTINIFAIFLNAPYLLLAISLMCLAIPYVAIVRTPR